MASIVEKGVLEQDRARQIVVKAAEDASSSAHMAIVARAEAENYKRAMEKAICEHEALHLEYERYKKEKEGHGKLLSLPHSFALFHTLSLSL